MGKGRRGVRSSPRGTRELLRGPACYRCHERCRPGLPRGGPPTQSSSFITVRRPLGRRPPVGRGAGTPDRLARGGSPAPTLGEQLRGWAVARSARPIPVALTLSTRRGRCRDKRFPASLSSAQRAAMAGLRRGAGRPRGARGARHRRPRGRRRWRNASPTGLRASSSALAWWAPRARARGCSASQVAHAHGVGRPLRSSSTRTASGPTPSLVS